MAYTSIPLWYFRTDSNIVVDEKADELRNIYQIFQDWKEQTDNNNKNRLTITCFISNNEATFITSTTGSYPLCNNCRD